MLPSNVKSRKRAVFPDKCEQKDFPLTQPFLF